MVEDKIAIALKDIAKFKDELRDVKKDMRAEEKIDNDQYIQLKSAHKDLRGQLKDMEDDWASQLKEDDFYNKLRETRLRKEEMLAHSQKDLFDAVAKLPMKATQMKMETEMGPINIQIHPEMKVFVNGKEEKKSA